MYGGRSTLQLRTKKYKLSHLLTFPPDTSYSTPCTPGQRYTTTFHKSLHSSSTTPEPTLPYSIPTTQKNMHNTASSMTSFDWVSHKKIPPYEPQSRVIAEQLILALINATCATLSQARLDLSYWSHAVRDKLFNYNLIPHLETKRTLFSASYKAPSKIGPFHTWPTWLYPWIISERKIRKTMMPRWLPILHWRVLNYCWIFSQNNTNSSPHGLYPSEFVSWPCPYCICRLPILFQKLFVPPFSHFQQQHDLKLSFIEPQLHKSGELHLIESLTRSTENESSNGYSPGLHLTPSLCCLRSPVPTSQMVRLSSTKHDVLFEETSWFPTFITVRPASPHRWHLNILFTYG